MGHCKSCIKSIDEANVLIFGTNKDMIPCFVTRNSHEFSFVPLATIDLARKFLPNVNQFFESLYIWEHCPSCCCKCGMTPGYWCGRYFLIVLIISFILINLIDSSLDGDYTEGEEEGLNEYFLEDNDNEGVFVAAAW